MAQTVTPRAGPVRPTGVRVSPPRVVGATGRDWHRTLRRACAAGVAVAVVVLALSSPIAPGFGTRVADAMSYPVEAVAIVCCVPALRAATGRTRLTWSLVCALLVIWLAADLCWLGAELLPAAAELDSAATTLYLLGTVPMACALVVVPVGGWERGAALRVLLDVFVLAFSTLAAADVLVLHDVLGARLDQDALVAAFYPVSDVLLASGALALSRRLEGRPRTDLLLAAAAFWVYAVTDLGYSWVELRGTDYFSTPLAAGYTIGPMLLGLAALAARRDLVAATGRPLQRHARTRSLSVVPDAAVLSAGVVCIAVPPHTWHEWTLVVLGAGSALARSVLTEWDSTSLRRGLEDRVERRTAELVALGDRNRRILASMAEGVAGVDRDGRVTLLNAAALRLLDLDAAGADPAYGIVPRVRVCELLGVHDVSGCPVHAVLAHGGTAVVESRTGGGLPVEVTVGRMVEGVGSAEVLVSFRDLSEREEVEQLKREFVTAVSHELRTPLSAVRGALEVLADGDAGELPDAARRMVATAERGGLRLARLVDDIIDVERLAAGTFDVVPTPRPLGPLLHAACESMAPLADQSGVVLAVGSTTTEEALVDADRVEQVLANLVGNAVKFSPRGSTVTLTCAAADGPGRREVVVTVRDQGRGIPPEDVPHVFERFRQVSVADGRTLGGAGLGLTIARSIVELHGGRIWVTSELGRGTAFHVALVAAD